MYSACIGIAGCLLDKYLYERTVNHLVFAFCILPSLLLRKNKYLYNNRFSKDGCSKDGLYYDKVGRWSLTTWLLGYYMYIVVGIYPNNRKNLYYMMDDYFVQAIWIVCWCCTTSMYMSYIIYYHHHRKSIE
jgi:hypothetical protein